MTTFLFPTKTSLNLHIILLIQTPPPQSRTNPPLSRATARPPVLQPPLSVQRSNYSPTEHILIPPAEMSDQAFQESPQLASTASSPYRCMKHLVTFPITPNIIKPSFRESQASKLLSSVLTIPPVCLLQLHLHQKRTHKPNHQQMRKYLLL